MDPLLPPMCLDLSEMIKEEEIGRQREKQGETQGEGKAPVSVEWRKKNMRGGGWWEWGGEGCCWHEAGALCFTEPLASFCLCLSLPLADVNNNSASAERTQVSTIVLL